MIAHPHDMARFSAWANQRLHGACAQLPAGELERDRDAFFDSILGTLNHILLVDLLYRERIEGRDGSRFGALNEILHHDLGALTEAQAASDAWYVDLLRDLGEEALREPIAFTTLLDEPEHWKVPRWVYYSNLFQHQVHHRGQEHNMLSQAGIDPPSVGFIEWQIELGEGIERRRA